MLISIAIPNFNRARLISETLDSLLAQAAAEWEALIIDDGFTDESEKIILEYVERDPRFKFYNRHSFLKAHQPAEIWV